VTGDRRETVLVVGAGVIGLSIALRLAMAGKDVTVIDRQAPGRGCSFGNVGRIATECVEPLASPETLRNVPRHIFGAGGPVSIRARYALRVMPWLLRFARASLPHNYWRGVAALQDLQGHSLAALTRLVDDAGIASLLKTSGHLAVSERAGSKARLGERQRELERLGAPSQFMSRRRIRQLAPGLSDRIDGGLYFPDTAQVLDPFLLCRGLAQAIERHGGRILLGEVQTIRPASPTGYDVGFNDGQRHAGLLVIAAGAWARPLVLQLGHRLPLETERGYHVTTSGRSSDLDVPVESLERRTVMSPMSEGLRISGFVEFGGLGLPPNPRHFDALRRHLHALMPGAELAGNSEWMGFRPSLPDHLPVIGRCTRHPDALLALGHQHLGLTLSGITAEIVESLVCKRTPPVDVAPFRCDRFERGA
jgi:D-amino-acid dehydrogenase